MQVKQLFGQQRRLVSFEFFPPATPVGEAALRKTIETLRPLKPAFVSVTKTGNKPPEASVELAAMVRDLGIVSAAHITGITATRDEMARLLDHVVATGIHNVVALRGDGPKDPSYRPPADGFRYGVDLVRFIRERGYPLCLLGGGYPEGHVECRDRDEDVRHLKEKVDAGLDVVVTQLFYDNADYWSFVDRCRAAGIMTPLVPGIMPITNVPQIERIAAMCGAGIPTTLRAGLERARNDEAAAFEVGVAHATEQCIGLLRGGAPGIHFYTLNKSPATRAITERLAHEGLLT
jgi:methylenetetrahydrofolate reductase (NADPH)